MSFTIDRCFASPKGALQKMLHAAATVLVAGNVMAASSIARAATLERLSDGHIVLTVLGEKLTFREQDAKNVVVLFPTDRCRPYIKGVHATLADWLADPELAQCFGRTLETDHVPGSKQSVSLEFYPSFKDGTSVRASRQHMSKPYPPDEILFPGHIPISDLPYTPQLYGQNRIAIGHPATPRMCRGSTAAPDDLGFRSLLGPDDQPSGRYSLSPELRLDSASGRSCIACYDRFGWTCYGTAVSSDSRVAITMSWRENDYRGARPGWLQLDAALRKMTRSILRDRPTEEFQ